MPDIDLNQIFHDEHERAKQQRAASGYKDESFMPHAMVIGADEKIIMIACPFANNQEKLMAMNYLWMTAREEKAIAVILSSDARLIKGEPYCSHYGITLEEFDEHRLRTLKEVGGSYGDLPREVWEDIVMSWAKGPSIPDGHLSTPYKEGPEDTVVFDPTRDDKDGIVRNKMMTSWW